MKQKRLSAEKDLKLKQSSELNDSSLSPEELEALKGRQVDERAELDTRLKQEEAEARSQIEVHGVAICRRLSLMVVGSYRRSSGSTSTTRWTPWGEHMEERRRNWQHWPRGVMLMRRVLTPWPYSLQKRPGEERRRL